MFLTFLYVDVFVQGFDVKVDESSLTGEAELVKEAPLIGIPCCMLAHSDGGRRYDACDSCGGQLSTRNNFQANDGAVGGRCRYVSD